MRKLKRASIYSSKSVKSNNKFIGTSRISASSTSFVKLIFLSTRSTWPTNFELTSNNSDSFS